jgi:hypothetical protein
MFFFIEKLSKYAAKLVIFLAEANVTLFKTAGLTDLADFPSFFFLNYCLCGEYGSFRKTKQSKNKTKTAVARNRNY